VNRLKVSRQWIFGQSIALFSALEMSFVLPSTPIQASFYAFCLIGSHSLSYLLKAGEGICWSKEEIAWQARK
jgi:hypothetical protein